MRNTRLGSRRASRRAALLAAGALCVFALAAAPAAAQAFCSVSDPLRDGALPQFSVSGQGEHHRMLGIIVGCPIVPGNRYPLFADGTVIRRQVAENTAPGTAIGAAFVATDPDGDAVSYRLGGPDGGSFTIGPKDGVLKTKAALDHEAKAKFTVDVVASDSSDEFTLSITITVTDVDEPPLAPAAPTVTAVRHGVLRATWTAPNNAGRPAITDYDVQYRYGSSGAWVDVAHTGTATSADIGGLSVGRTYQVRVRAKNDEGVGAWSQPAAGAVLTMPLTPTALTATKDGRLAIDLSWTAPQAVHGRAAVTGYQVQWSANGTSEWTGLATPGATTTTHTDTGLSPGTTRHYRVRASSSVGASGWSNVDSATTDANVAPVFTDGAVTTRLVAENTAAGQNVGTAVAATDTEDDTVSYTLGGADAASFAIDAAAGQLKVKSALDHEDDASYTVTVGASDVYGGSASITVTIMVTDVDEPPAAPTGLAAAALREFTLRATWTAPGNAGRPAITGYDVQYRAGTSGDWSNHGHTGTATSAEIGSLTAGSHQVRVRAKNDEGEGAWTQPAAVMVLAAPLAPAGLTATKDRRLAIDLSWTAPEAAVTRAAVTGYAVQWSADGTSGWTDLATTAAGTTTHSHTGLSPATARHYRVRASSGMGNGAWSSVASATTDANVVPVFTDGAATARSVAENTAPGQNVGTAVAATDAEGDELSYTLGGADAAVFAIDAGSGQVEVKSALDYESRASYTVTVGVSDIYAGSASTTVTITVTDVDEPPSPPSGLTVAALSEFTLRATWLDPGDVGRPAVTGYDVQYRQGTSGAWSSHAHTGTATSATISNLIPSTIYQVRVRARNAEGNGGWALPAAVTTAPAAAQLQQQAALSVPWDWPLAPGEIANGRSFRLMFITSDGRDATSMLTADYNTHVQDAAARNRVLAATGLSEHFRAFVSPTETAHHLRPNTGTRSSDPGASSPIYWVGGTKVADSYADLYDGSWDTSNGGRATYESGARLRSAVEVWTGSRADGTHWAGHRVGDDRAMVGMPHAAGRELGSGTARRATERKSLYAISPLITVRAAAQAITVRGANGVKLGVREWSIRVWWPDPDGFECGYLVEWAKEGEPYSAANRHTIGAFAAHNTTIPVEPGTTYTVRVSELRSQIGGSDTVLAEITAKTQGTAPGVQGQGQQQRPPVGVAPPPVLEAARVSGAELALRFDGALDETSAPAAGAFAAAVAGSARSVSAVAVSGQTVTLTLAEAVAAGEAVTVGYAPPADGTRLRGAGGGDVAAFAGHVVTNDTPPPARQAAQALTASVAEAPAEHEGTGKFAVRVAFSEPVAGRARDAVAAMPASGGTLVRAVREDGRADQWRLTLQPSSHEAVTVTLPATADCAAAGAICTADGRALASPFTVTVPGPPGLSVADARAREGADASLDFLVSLSRTAAHEVKVRYETGDGTAKAGEDYQATRGWLTLAAGETRGTVSVALLDDAKDEGAETFTLVLSRARGAWIVDGEATGEIVNSDPMPVAWLARAGRTIGAQAVAAVTGRLAGGGASHLTVGGHRLGLDVSGGAAAAALGMEPGAGGEPGAWIHGNAAPAPAMTGRELLLGSSLHVESESATESSLKFAAWGRVATGGFGAAEDRLRMDGQVTTGFFGADVAGGDWLAGAAVSYSEGEGAFAFIDDASGAVLDEGTMKSTLTSVLPYARVAFGERVMAWGLAGYGAGELLAEHGAAAERQRYRTGLTMMLGAAGARGVLLPAPAGGGLALALGTDALWVRMALEETEGLAGAQAETTRLRLMLDASHAIALGGGVLTPSLELGVRHDGGDAETGAGVDVGGGLSVAVSGVTAAVRGRGLLAAGMIREWGASGTLRIGPGADGRGLSLTLAPTVGAAAPGSERLWSAADAHGFAPDAFAAPRRLDAEVGYGLAGPAGVGTAMPFAGVGLAGDARTWRAGVRWQVAPEASLGLQGTRTESAGGSEHGLRLHGSLRW